MQTYTCIHLISSFLLHPIGISLPYYIYMQQFRLNFPNTYYVGYVNGYVESQEAKPNIERSSPLIISYTQVVKHQAEHNLEM